MSDSDTDIPAAGPLTPWLKVLHWVASDKRFERMFAIVCLGVLVYGAWHFLGAFDWLRANFDEAKTRHFEFLTSETQQSKLQTESLQRISETNERIESVLTDIHNDNAKEHGLRKSEHTKMLELLNEQRKERKP